MTDIQFAVLILLLAAIGLAPFVLIVFGIIRRQKSNGFTLFMSGAAMLSLFIAGAIGALFNLIPIIKDAKIISWIVFVPLLYGSYRLFTYITQKYGEKSKYLSHCRNLIRHAESTSLPSCEDILLKLITEQLSKTPEQSIPCPSKRAAETSVYRLSLSLVDSEKFRTFSGLTSQGNQLVHICRYCLDYFLEVGYITDKEKLKQNEYLDECVSHNDRYIFGIL